MGKGYSGLAWAIVALLMRASFTKFLTLHFTYDHAGHGSLKAVHGCHS